MHSYESPFSKGGFRGIFQVSNAYARPAVGGTHIHTNPPSPLFLKGGCKQLYALLNKLGSGLSYSLNSTFTKPTKPPSFRANLVATLIAKLWDLLALSIQPSPFASSLLLTLP